MRRLGKSRIGGLVALSGLVCSIACSPSKPHTTEAALQTKHECEEPDLETLLFDGRPLRVTTQHCLDSSGPDEDGYYEYFYDYRLISFEDADTTLFARTYTSDPEEAHLLGIKIGGERKLLTAPDLSRPIVRAAVEHLRKAGMTNLTWLDPDNDVDGYSPIP